MVVEAALRQQHADDERLDRGAGEAVARTASGSASRSPAAAPTSATTVTTPRTRRAAVAADRPVEPRLEERDRPAGQARPDAARGGTPAACRRTAHRSRGREAAAEAGRAGRAGSIAPGSHTGRTDGNDARRAVLLCGHGSRDAEAVREFELLRRRCARASPTTISPPAISNSPRRRSATGSPRWWRAAPSGSSRCRACCSPRATSRTICRGR